MPRFYLDSSAIVKRYVREAGTPGVRAIYRSAHVGRSVLCASEWNIGEALGVLQRKARLASRPRAYGGQKGKLHAELSLLVRMGSFELAPVWSSLLRESWVVAERRELYVAAALQIASARSLACEYFVSGDGALLKAARTEGLKAFDPEADEKRIGQVV